MKLIFTILVLTILSQLVFADNINVIQSDTITRVNSSNGNSLFPYSINNNKLFVNTEVPPTILEGRAYIATGWTYSISYTSSKNFITNSNGFEQYSLTNPVLSIGGAKYVNNTDINNPIRVNPFPITDSVLTSNIPPFWSKHYYGGWSPEKIGSEIVLFTHGENKNEYENNICYQNDIDTSVSCSSCYSGVNSQGVYSDCAKAYSSFLGMVHSNQNTGVGFIDEGPVIWPTNGYSNKNTITSSGSLGMASHVNSITNGNYIYLFYFNNGSGNSANARNQGIKIARGLVSESARPGSFQTWYKLSNGTEDWENSLPSTWYSNGVYVTDTGKSIYSETFKNTLPLGWIKLNGEDWYNFDGNWMKKGTIGNDIWWNYHNGWMVRNDKGFKGFNKLDNYDINGGRASNILGEDNTIWDPATNWWSNAASNDKNLIRTGTTEFSVAKLKGTDYFIGVESDFGWQIIGTKWNSVSWTGLRISKDLIHWGEVYVLKDTIGQTWDDLKLGHAKFLSSDFLSNKEIDPNGFYLTGSYGKGTSPCSNVGCWQQLHYKYLKITIETNGCTNENWTYSDGTCQSDNTLTRTWTKTGTCSGGITHPTTETISCNQNSTNPICSQNPRSVTPNEINSSRLDWISNKISLSDLIRLIKIYRYCN